MRIEYSNLSLKEDRKTCTLKTEQDEIRFDCIRASNREVKNFNCGTSNSRRVTITTVETAKEACIILTFLLRTKGDQTKSNLQESASEADTKNGSAAQAPPKVKL